MVTTNTYIVEGETERELVKHLISEKKIPHGKTKIFNIWDKNVRKILRILNRKNNCVYIIFDTDVLSNINRFNENLITISRDNSVKSITLLQQTENLEDELIYCCRCTRAVLFNSFSVIGTDNFKNKFIKVSNLASHLNSLGFVFSRLWSKNLNVGIQIPAKKTREWKW